MSRCRISDFGMRNGRARKARSPWLVRFNPQSAIRAPGFAIRNPQSAIRNRQSGMVFVAALVLLAGMTVVIVALAHEVSLDLKMSANLAEADQALEIAKVGIDAVIYTSNNDPNWRTTFTSGTWYGGFPLGGGTFKVCAIDDDGDLADCPIDPVTVQSVGTYQGTTRTVSATLTPPVHESMMFLAYTWNEKIRMERGPRVYGDLCSGDRVERDATAPDHRGNIYVEKADKVGGGLDDDDTDVVLWAQHPVQPAVDFTWLVNRASTISAPLTGDTYKITDKRIAYDSNPFGFSNSSGIYHIDARGHHVTFTRCYIEATIVITDAKTVTFDKACVHFPKETYYPALAVEGDVVYSFDQNLSEPERSVHLNGDDDKDDIFTPEVRGVVYATKSIQGLQATGGTNIVRFRGALIARNITLIGSGCIFEQDAALSTNLVNQFEGIGLKLVKGSTKVD